MTQYAESSAVLAWLLGESRGGDVAEILVSADLVVTSELTLIEVDRALHRYVAAGVFDRRTAEQLSERLDELTAGWGLEPVSRAVVEQARRSFPDDAIRSLDAIHLATAVVVRSSIADLDVLSLDDRVRASAVALGFRVLPD